MTALMAEATSAQWQVTFTPWQQLGLAFLLGSFAVATLSDLRRLSAQREFVEVWWLFALAVLAYDFHEGWSQPTDRRDLVIKWALIVGLSLASWIRIGLLFRLAPGDVAAMAAAASLLPWWWVLGYYTLAKVLSYALGPMLSRGRKFYPFMPVVSVTTLAILGLTRFV
jgi:hypothetical protein